MPTGSRAVVITQIIDAVKSDHFNGYTLIALKDDCEQIITMFGENRPFPPELVIFEVQVSYFHLTPSTNLFLFNLGNRIQRQ